MDELVFGLPNFRIVNAAYTYARPEGSRFNDGARGAWYCAFDAATALAEVSFHKTVEYQEIDRFDDSVTYQALLADFNAPFHDIRGARRLRRMPRSAELCRVAGAGRTHCSTPARWASSTRACARQGGTNLACFRPALVGNVRKAQVVSVNMGGFGRSRRSTLFELQ